MNKLLAALLSVVICGVVYAQTTMPAGAQGKDWDQTTKKLGSGVQVKIVGQNTTVATRHDNTSSIILFVDGIELARSGRDAAETQLVSFYSISGKHTFQVRCFNTYANADTCVVQVTRADDVEDFPSLERPAAGMADYS